MQLGLHYQYKTKVKQQEASYGSLLLPNLHRNR